MASPPAASGGTRPTTENCEPTRCKESETERECVSRAMRRASMCAEFRAGEISALEGALELKERSCHREAMSCGAQKEQQRKQLEELGRRPTWKRVLVIIVSVFALGYAGGRAHQWKREREKE